MILRKRSLATALVLAIAASGAIVAPSFAAVNPAKTVTIWNGAETAAKDAQTPIIAEWAKTQGITINGRPILKPDKVEPTLDEALAKVTIEWME